MKIDERISRDLWRMKDLQILGFSLRDIYNQMIDFNNHIDI